MVGPDGDLEVTGGRATEGAVRTDEEPFGVASGDVLHGLRAEAGRRLAIDDGDVGTEQGVPDVGWLSSGGSEARLR